MFQRVIYLQAVIQQRRATANDPTWLDEEKTGAKVEEVFQADGAMVVSTDIKAEPIFEVPDEVDAHFAASQVPLILEALTAAARLNPAHFTQALVDFNAAIAE